MKDNIKLYDAVISYVSSINNDRVIPSEESEKRKILGYKYNTYLVDIHTNESYKILSKEGNHELAFGVDDEEIYVDESYVVFYKKHDFSKDSSFKQQCLKELYDKKAKQSNTRKFYTAELIYISSAYYDENGLPIVGMTRKDCKLGIISKGYFIALDNYQKYPISEKIFDSNDKICVNRCNTYACGIVELDIEDVPNKYRALADNYSKPKCKVLEFKKK